MTEEHVLLLVYVGGGAVVAFVLSLFKLDKDDDNGMTFVVIALWPAILAVLVAIAPVWLASRLGRWTRRLMGWGA